MKDMRLMRTCLGVMFGCLLGDLKSLLKLVLY